MAVPVLALADDLITKLGTETGYTFTRRVAPYLKRSDVTGGKWLVVAAGDEQTIAARQVDRSTLTVDVAYQEPLPEKSSANPDPLENTTALDAAMQKLEDVKNLFRGGGALRDASYSGGFQFLSMVNSPIYRPDLMVDLGIFTGVIRLQFVGEIESE